MNYLVYKHTSPSGKSYIGITNDYERRNAQHRYYDWCPAFHAAILKYGWDNFTHEILYTGLSDTEAGVIETRLIYEHNTLYPAGYNLMPGGSNKSHTDETRKRISAAKKGQPGRVITEQEKTKRSATRSGRGYQCTDAVKAAVARANARSFLVTDPDGNEITVINLTQFCKEKGLHYPTMSQVARGLHSHHKGWLCRRLTC